MRKWTTVLLAVVALAGASLMAVDLQTSQLGSTCGGFHFVNNQSGTTVPGTLTATISGQTCTTVAYKVTPGGTQHFLCSIEGTVTSASTNLSGNLVLSDCFPGGKEPPPCVPTEKDPCPK